MDIFAGKGAVPSLLKKYGAVASAAELEFGWAFVKKRGGDAPLQGKTARRPEYRYGVGVNPFDDAMAAYQCPLSFKMRCRVG